ncbi:MAG: DUF5615 family PIN-like protein [Acidobacteriota bacterium]
MRFVLDMNLSPEWVEYLEQRGHDVAHWAQVGDPKADDTVVAAWGRGNDAVVVSHDLDFGRILALTHAQGPSVIQFRNQPLLPEDAGEAFIEMIAACDEALERGAIVTFDGEAWRAKILPLG